MLAVETCPDGTSHEQVPEMLGDDPKMCLQQCTPIPIRVTRDAVMLTPDVDGAFSANKARLWQSAPPSFTHCLWNC